MKYESIKICPVFCKNSQYYYWLKFVLMEVSLIRKGAYLFQIFLSSKKFNRINSSLHSFRNQ